MFPNGSLSGLGLTSACETALYQKVNCDYGLSSLMTDGYVGSFDNATLTALICDAGCKASITQLHDTVSGNCGETAELVPGLPFLGLVDECDWNQSCFVDPTTGENCNDVIAGFPDVTDLSEFPKSDLCSYCSVEKLAMMQADAYTEVYDDNWKSIIFNVTVPASTPNCVSGSIYTTQEGDTCDSIALAHAATMFYINASILNCSSILTGTSLCLPKKCNSVYSVQPDDTCTSIAVDAGILTENLLTYNSQLNRKCTNLQSPNPNWGSTLCVSTPGGTYTGQVLNTSSSTGSVVVDPPTGATVAQGTTTDYGAWFVNDASLNFTCTQICLANQITINLFTQANSSLSRTTCDSDLVPAVPSSSTPTSSTTVTTTSQTVSAATTPPGPTQSGIAANCNAYYIAQANQTCADIEAAFGITKAEFLAWNPAISSDCLDGFWAEEAYCVGGSGTASVTITATSTLIPATTSSSAAPSGPTQSDIPVNCVQYDIAQAGDSCETVEVKYGITDDEFHAWNPAVSSDCMTGFWAKKAYCVAVS
ncbi:hypothetical protein SI65_09940 [Aspergillus cristatus]|uniref:LysM domain-containing protein n=1 Tax=Aspergillus cristatus TaxID=573508 RepID=A0A1E3B0Y8_ASPCR|nr:hypothetical protein SI65_09940 [Aspergillus cristatus]